MKKVFKILSILIIVLTAYIASLNVSQSIDFHVWKNIHYQVNLVYVLFSELIAGIIAGFTWMFANYLASQEKFKEYKKKLEQTTVTAECDSSKVSVLEAKIEVLEKALKSALEKND